MADDRRFDDDEIAEILERAASVDDSSRQPVADGGGLTLAELQDIGREVGIAPERMAEAARVVAGRAAAGLQRGADAPVRAAGDPPAGLPGPLLGLPRAVGRSVPLPRALTDDEWERLVVDLRETFAAAGKVEIHGSLRTWRNGNLEVHVEPSVDGHRLRMSTRKGDAVPLVLFGGVLSVMGAFLLAAGLLGGEPLGVVVASGFVAAMGVGQLAVARTWLPAWARRRAEQMEGVGARVSAMLEG